MTDKIEINEAIFDEKSPQAKEPKKSESDAPKKTIESHFREYLKNQNELAVYEDDSGLVRLTMEWRDAHWQPIHMVRRKDRAERFCSGFSSLYRNGSVDSCQDLMTPALYNLGKVLKDDPKRHLISTKNKMLEITKEGVRVSDPDRKLLVRTYSAVEIDEDRIKLDMGAGGIGSPYFYQLRSTEELEKDTKFGNFITSLYPDAHTRGVLQQFLGGLLTRMQLQTVPVLEGEGGTGKSVLLKLIAMLIGNSKALNLARPSPYQVASIHLAPLIVCDEIRGKIDTTLFKQLAGRSPLPGEHKFESPFTFIFDGGMLFSWNERPRMDDHSSAIEQRMVIFRASSNIKRGTDKEIPDYEKVIFASEADVVLEWCLQGALKVVRRGRLPTGNELGDTLLKHKAELGQDSDPLRGFIDEYGIQPSHGSVVYDKDDVYELLKRWLSKEGRMPGAPMVKSVALRHLKRILENMYGQGCLGGELKVPSMSRRVPAIRIKFGYQVNIRPLRQTDVQMAELDPACVDEMTDAGKAYQAEKKRLEGMEPADREKAMTAKMIEDGYELTEDPLTKQKTWSKVHTIDIGTVPDPFN